MIKNIKDILCTQEIYDIYSACMFEPTFDKFKIKAEQLATDIELLCQNIKAPSNTVFQIRKSSSIVYANIREANYGQSKAHMLSKFEIALKECSETEGWLQLLFNTKAVDEDTYKKHRNLCGRIRRMLITSCKTLKENSR